LSLPTLLKGIGLGNKGRTGFYHDLDLIMDLFKIIPERMNKQTSE
jgi:hypothetical protein